MRDPKDINEKPQQELGTSVQRPWDAGAWKWSNESLQPLPLAAFDMHEKLNLAFHHQNGDNKRLAYRAA